MSANQLSQTVIRIVKSAEKALSNAHDDTSWSDKESPTKWSKKEILGHLIDSAYNNHRRFKQSLTQEHLVFDGYDQVNEVKLHQYQQREVADIIQLWVSTNTQLSYLIASLPDKLLNRQSSQHNFFRIGFKQIPEGQATTLTYLIRDYIWHMEHHLNINDF